MHCSTQLLVQQVHRSKILIFLALYRRVDFFPPVRLSWTVDFAPDSSISLENLQLTT